MMLGVRVAVGRQSSPLSTYELTDEDFEEVIENIPEENVSLRDPRRFVKAGCVCF